MIIKNNEFNISQNNEFFFDFKIVKNLPYEIVIGRQDILKYDLWNKLVQQLYNRKISSDIENCNSTPYPEDQSILDQSIQIQRKQEPVEQPSMRGITTVSPNVVNTKRLHIKIKNPVDSSKANEQMSKNTMDYVDHGIKHNKVITVKRQRTFHPKSIKSIRLEARVKDNAREKVKPARNWDEILTPYI